MAFPSQFLDEIRARVGLVNIIGRSVKLSRKGREHIGLCPFHNEKTPSFSVNEEKGFFHCFGCGAHGDVIGFVMRTDGVPFPEAVEMLAGTAGVEVPVQSPDERRRERRRTGMVEVLDVAANWYQAELGTTRGKEALDYLLSRGLNKKSIENFRIGFSPDGGGEIKQEIESRLSKKFKNPNVQSSTLVEIGLLAISDGSQKTYPFFRNRIMFPITDRRGRVIAFGGRKISEVKGPKYINSPETPMFQKGRTLYNLYRARSAINDGESLIVCEGYMDVIALSLAGFRGGVAPLGTALTELQLVELWRQTSEPILCFDGDAAGARAAGRAALQALPLLKPGNSLRFAMLRPGDDPDSLIARDGKNAMQSILEQAKPLADVIWELEVGLRPLDTPELRADLDHRLAKAVKGISDERVRSYYRKEFNTRLWHMFRVGSSGAGRSKPGLLGRQNLGKVNPVTFKSSENGFVSSSRADVARRRGQQAVLATLISHPSLMTEFEDEFNQLELDGDLDKLRQELQNLSRSTADLDANEVSRHFIECGQERVLTGVLDEQVLLLAPFARAGTPLERVRAGLRNVFDLQLQVRRKAEVRTLGREVANSVDQENEAKVLAFREDVEAGEQHVSEIDNYDTKD